MALFQGCYCLQEHVDVFDRVFLVCFINCEDKGVVVLNGSLYLSGVVIGTCILDEI
jgi:hypothetical protein